MSQRHVIAGLLFIFAVFIFAGRELRSTFAALPLNGPPVAVDDNYTIHNQMLLSPMSNDYNPENDGLSFNAIDTQPQHGQLFIYTTGVYTYRANLGYTGSDSFTYSIKDSTNNIATATVYITVVNQPPVAVTDTYTVHNQLLITPPANDYDPEGDGVSFDSIVTQPQHGNLFIYTTGTYTYRATYGYVGADTFTYKIKDGLGLYTTGTVNINVVNQPPTAIADFYVKSGPMLITPAENDSDPDPDSISFQSILTQPSHGTLQVYTTGTYTYSPTGGYTGFDSFTYRIVDSLGATADATVILLILSQAPPSASVPWGCICPSDSPSHKSSFEAIGGGLAHESGGPAGSSGPRDHDPVNLATGRENYTPDPDLSVYNPNGPSVLWQRAYVGNQALANTSGYGSPGLSRGWVHNYDLSLQGTSGSWTSLRLNYPNGSYDLLTPQLSGGQPTGGFTTATGAPYRVEGVPGTPTGRWQSVTITWKDNVKWKFTFLSGTTYALNQLTNRTGQTLNFSWDSNRALTQVSDQSSNVLLTLAYTGGKLVTATDVYNRQVRYSFSTASATAQSMLQSVSQIVTAGTSNPPAHWTYAYDINKGQQLSTITVPSPTGTGNSSATINYDSIGRVGSLVDANGNQHVYTYNTSTTLVQVKDAANNVLHSWTQKFNSSGLDTGFTDAASHSTSIVYNDTGNPYRPTSVTDRNGHQTTYTYDSFGNVTATTDPRGVTTSYTWSYSNFALGRLTSVQQGSKPATSFTYYEPSGLVNTITRPAPNNAVGTTTTTFTYDSLGNVLTMVAPGNDAVTTITTSWNYTTDGQYSQSAKVAQPLTISDNLGHVTHLRYDSQGRVTSRTDAIGNETNFSYNLVGQPDTKTNPATGQTGSGRSHTTFAYLYAGGPVTTVTEFDENNTSVRQVTNTYGPEGELLAVGGSAEPVTKTYDALYRVKTLKDGNNNTTTYTYNSIGAVATITTPGAEVTQFTSYDNGGNLLQRIDGNGVTTNYVYNDSESKLTDIQYPATTSLNVHFTYDSYGRRSGMTDATGSQTYTYGNLDERLSTVTTYTSLAAKTISYAYYPNGSRQTMTTPAGTFSYSYDGAGRAASVTNPFNETTSWSYENNNWLQAQTSQNGATANYTHNAMGQVTRLLNQLNSTTVSDFSSISYDGVGNRISITSTIAGASSLDGTTAYTYDSKDQLTQETSTRNGGFTDNFIYDSAGNPTSFKGVTKSYNSNNQQTGTGFVYDSNGNPTTYAGTTLTFDPENRMTAFGSVLTAGYNGDSLRAWKQNASGRTYFLYDGSIPVVELDGTGAVAATNTFGVGGLISRTEGSTTVFYTFDVEGNVSDRSDGSGSVQANHLFSVFGASMGTAAGDPFGYRAQFGYYTDNETGLQNLTYRYYDPATGRFVTPDPIGENGGINLYSYVGNSPSSYVDPLGLSPGETDLTPDLSGDMAAAMMAFYQEFCTDKGDGPYVVKLDPRIGGSDRVVGGPIGDGACMQLIQKMLESQGTPLGPAGFGRVKQGAQVMGNPNMKMGTVIASGWKDGYYPNYYPHGNHVAIFIEWVNGGFRVLEQVNGTVQITSKTNTGGGYYSNPNAYNVVITGPRVDGVPARQRYPVH